jgi:hypothetical protein
MTISAFFIQVSILFHRCFPVADLLNSSDIDDGLGDDHIIGGKGKDILKGDAGDDATTGGAPKP